MKNFLFLLLGITFTGTMAFGIPSTSATANVSLTALTLPTIKVEDIDFGNYIIGEAKPQDAKGKITITGGTPKKDIGLSVPKSIVLTNKSEGNETVAVNMSLGKGYPTPEFYRDQVTLNESGEGEAILIAFIEKPPTKEGDYEGTVTVTAVYN